MLENCHSKEERFLGVQQIINSWLEERQELVVSYCSLSGANDFSPECQNSLSKLRNFCQTLIDYVSAGHFEVYDQLAQEAKAFEDNVDVLSSIYPQITTTTDIVLNFHETYDTDEHCLQALDKIKQELSTLGEALSLRFSLEDELIHALHISHSPDMKKEVTKH